MTVLHWARIEHTLTGILGLTPPELNGDSAPEVRAAARAVRQWGDELFATNHAAYLQVFKPWVRAVNDYDAAVSAENPKPAAIAKALAVKGEAEALRRAAMDELLRARAGEEFARYGTAITLAGLAGDEAAVTSLAKRLEVTHSWVSEVFPR